MLRSGVIGTARKRVSALAVATVLAVMMALFLHSPSGPSRAAPTDLAGMMGLVAQESAAANDGPSDFFLKIDGIPGESRAKGHENQIEIHSFSWGATNSGSAARTGGAAAGKVTFSDFSFAKLLDKSSPLLLQAVATGKRVPTVTLFAVRAGEGSQEYMKITLSDVLISSYQNSGASGGGGPQDSFSVNFAKISFDYKPQKPDGSLDTAVHGGWDLKANKAA